MGMTRIRWLIAVAFAAINLVPLPSANGEQEPRGLWPTGFTGQQSRADCAGWWLDENDFCFANDQRNGLEIGVRFKSSRDLQVTGVRIYRIETATVRASLWRSDGTLLARGTFADGSAHRWQDMTFAAPVRISAGEIYVASYFTPGTKYAFQHRYFTDSGRTVGPVTALKATETSPNGVHCYADAVCGSFPVRGYRDSTYWVTPLWQEITTPTSESSTDSPTDSPIDSPTDSPTDSPAEPSPTTGSTDTTAPQVVSTAPRGGASGAEVDGIVKVKLSEPVRRASLNRMTVRLLRKGSPRPVRADVRYDAGRRQVVVDPRSPLRPGTAYRVEFTTGVRDLAGNRLDNAPARHGRQPATWLFRTRPG